MLEEIKDALGISADDKDGELSIYITACETDMRRVGIGRISEDDPAIVALVSLFCKSLLDWRGAGDKYHTAYEKMRDGLSLFGDYKETDCEA